VANANAVATTSATTATTAAAAPRASAAPKAPDVTPEQRAAASKELEGIVVPYPPLVATPSPAVAPIIDKIAAVLLRHPALIGEVGGHAADDELEEVAWARANLVASSLAARGIGRERLVVKTYGKGTPRAQGTNDDARKQNRRVEVKIVTLP